VVVDNGLISFHNYLKKKKKKKNEALINIIKEQSLFHIVVQCGKLKKKI